MSRSALAHEPQGHHLAAHIAGGALIIGALFRFLIALVEPHQLGSEAGPAAIAPGILHLLVGGGIVLNRPGAVRWARALILFGMVAYGAVLLSRGAYPELAIELTASVAILLLLIGQPGWLRTSLCAVALLGYFAIATLVLVDPAGAARLYLQTFQLIEGQPLATARGRNHPYSLRCIGASWFQRPASTTDRRAPGADIWLVDIETGAELLVLTEELPGDGRIDFKTWADALLGQLRAELEDFEVISNEPFEGEMTGRLIRSLATIDDKPVEQYHALFEHRDYYAYTINAIAPKDTFTSQEPDLRAMIRSFRLDYTR